MRELRLLRTTVQPTQNPPIRCSALDRLTDLRWALDRCPSGLPTGLALRIPCGQVMVDYAASGNGAGPRAGSDGAGSCGVGSRAVGPNRTSAAPSAWTPAASLPPGAAYTLWLPCSCFSFCYAWQALDPICEGLLGGCRKLIQVRIGELAEDLAQHMQGVTAFDIAGAGVVQLGAGLEVVDHQHQGVRKCLHGCSSGNPSPHRKPNGTEHGKCLRSSAAPGPVRLCNPLSRVKSEPGARVPYLEPRLGISQRQCDKLQFRRHEEVVFGPQKMPAADNEVACGSTKRGAPIPFGHVLCLEIVCHLPVVVPAQALFCQPLSDPAASIQANRCERRKRQLRHGK
jgi:hypothetical protein